MTLFYIIRLHWLNSPVTWTITNNLDAVQGFIRFLCGSSKVIYVDVHAFYKFDFSHNYNHTYFYRAIIFPDQYV